jgi:phytoene desaturase (3,4-didehydrolycopene-forming)
VDVGKRLGVEYRLSTTVAEVKLSPDRTQAEGVTLSGGEMLYADVVLVNADLVYAYNNLLPHTPHATSLSKRPGSCSSISFYWYVTSAHSYIRPELLTEPKGYGQNNSGAGNA